MKITGVPICDVCNKPVDYIIRTRDEQKRREIITLVCHGEEETQYLDDFILQIANKIEYGHAFINNKLEGD